MIRTVQALFFGLLVILFAQTVWAGKIVGTVKVPGVKNPDDAIVYIEKVGGQFLPPEQPVTIDQTKQTYVPHVLAVLAGTTLEFQNNDNVLHNIHAVQNRKTLFNFAILPQRKVRKILKTAGVITLLCDVHSEMSAYVLVTQNPFSAKVDKNGNYTIDNVPPGSYTLAVWHERRNFQSKKIMVSKDGRIVVDFELRR